MPFLRSVAPAHRNTITSPRAQIARPAMPVQTRNTVDVSVDCDTLNSSEAAAEPPIPKRMMAQTGDER